MRINLVIALVVFSMGGIAQPPSVPTSPPATTAPAPPAPSTNTTVPALPQTALAVFGGYGQKIDGSVCFAGIVSQSSQTFDYNCVRLIPQRGTAPTILYMPGVATNCKSVWKITFYCLAQAGGGTTSKPATTTTPASSSTIGAFSLGAIGVINFGNISENGWFLPFGADIQKDAGGKSFPNFDLGIGYRFKK
jgi:hypothetical protein